jgi:hypothetical protein
LVKKRGFRNGINLAASPVPINAIYVLDYGPKAGITPLTPMEAFIELTRCGYLAKYVNATGHAIRNFDQCALIAGSVNVSRLTRPRSLSEVSNVGAMIADDLVRIAGHNGSDSQTALGGLSHRRLIST